MNYEENNKQQNEFLLGINAIFLILDMNDITIFMIRFVNT